MFAPRRCVEELLSLQAEVGLRNHQRLTALDIAGQYDGRTVLKARTAVRKAILRLAPAQRTLVLYHDDCLGHATPDYHQVTHTFSCAWSRVKFAGCLYKHQHTAREKSDTLWVL